LFRRDKSSCLCFPEGAVSVAKHFDYTFREAEQREQSPRPGGPIVLLVDLSSNKECKLLNTTSSLSVLIRSINLLLNSTYSLGVLIMSINSLLGLVILVGIPLARGWVASTRPSFRSYLPSSPISGRRLGEPLIQGRDSRRDSLDQRHSSLYFTGENRGGKY